MDKRKIAVELVKLATVLSAETFKCPECGTKVLKQTGYCVKCKKKVKEASELTSADKAYIKKEILGFIKANSEDMKTDEYASLKIKLHGPTRDSKWMDIDLEDLEKMAKALK